MIHLASEGELKKYVRSLHSGGDTLAGSQQDEQRFSKGGKKAKLLPTGDNSAIPETHFSVVE